MKRYQIAGIGNAIADVIASVDDSFLDAHAIAKGGMTLIEEDRAIALHAAMPAATEAPGGSVANSIAGLGALGLRAAFIGRVRDDAPGRAYVAAMSDEGITVANAPVAGADLPTSRCLIVVSPDGERSMSTFLGISSLLGPDDVSEDLCAQTELLLLEGYLFDRDPGKQAFLKAARATRAAGGRAGLSLSDAFCVNRHRDDFAALVRELDFVIGNESEWCALAQLDDVEAAVAEAATRCPLVVCTLGARGVIIRAGEQVVRVAVTPVDPVDTTGAGDQFAAGFLFGLATGRDLETAGRMGCIAAGEVISHFGARPARPIADLYREAGLI